MDKRTDLTKYFRSGLRPAGKDADARRIDYPAAARGLKKSIFIIYVIGLLIIVAVDVVYLKTGDKTATIFLADLILYNAAALVLGFVIYQVTARGWLRAYASESTLFSITDVSADAVYSIGADSLITAWSKGAERIFGYSEKEALGQTVGIVLPDDFMERDVEILGPLLTEGIVTGHRTLSVRKGGEVFPSEVSASLLKTPGGDPAGILFVSRDVTRQVALENDLHEARDELEIRVEERTAELKEANRMLKREIGERTRAQIALRESEEHFRSLIENATDIIVVVDHLARVEYVSPSIERVLGFAPPELSGIDAFSMAHPDDVPEIARALAETTVASGIVRSAEFRFRHKDGSYRMLEGIGTSVIDDLGNIRIIINGRDITERKGAEKKISILNEELEQSVADLQGVNKELEAFSYSVSHDLRAPLRAIDGFASMLQENHSEVMDADARRLLDIVIRNAGQMGELIEGLLQFSRFGRQEMRFVEVDIRDIALTVFSELTERDGQRADFLLGDLPPAIGDPMLLRQVYANLIGNALKFSAREPKSVIEAGCDAHGDENVYFVRDNGVGFDMDYADRLFGVFQRLHSTEDFEGTGIGLATVQRIVHRHGGRIWAEGAEGDGATLYFTLPVEAG